MIVAVVAVRMVQMAIHEVVYVIAVRNRLVSAIRPVNVSFVVASAGVRRRAVCRVLRCHRKRVFLHTARSVVVQTAVVEVVYVVVVLYRGVSTTGTVLMRVVRMRIHLSLSLPGLRRTRRLPPSGQQFVGVSQGVVYQIGNMPVCQCVKHMRSFPAT